jgi:hypothetical protein
MNNGNRKEMENGNFTGILFLDFQKDVVNHKILLTKLKYYKCDDLTISWVKSYLTREVVLKGGQRFNGKVSWSPTKITPSPSK